MLGRRFAKKDKVSVLRGVLEAVHFLQDVMVASSLHAPPDGATAGGRAAIDKTASVIQASLSDSEAE